MKGITDRKKYNIDFCNICLYNVSNHLAYARYIFIKNYIKYLQVSVVIYFLNEYIVKGTIYFCFVQILLNVSK